ncbi:hypothetical protein Q31a_28290 [Aureliella helgolandensis]|uniref:Uncharacterized protein n=1 Tax=Aureliella helgolandensis TaxID=2527968 RepID=A0A518G7E9_9BACT|nr:hypothetical protein Q31a_28290 [Aureliella helgolandensis]
MDAWDAVHCVHRPDVRGLGRGGALEPTVGQMVYIEPRTRQMVYEVQEGDW